jgi:beta-N-acetylhexosaminidase
MSGAAASGLDAITAAVTALIAGADMVMAWPKDLLTLQSAILTALEDGRLPRERLEEAAAAVIQLKVRYGIMP